MAIDDSVLSSGDLRGLDGELNVHVFVTGGTGFFGRALLRHWASTPETGSWRFTLLSRDPERFRQTHGDLLSGLDVRLWRGDVLDPASLPGDASFTHVLHAATDAGATDQLSPLQRFDQIVDGTRHVLDHATRLGVRRFLLTSSGGVYGTPPSGAISLAESWHGMPDPLQAHNAYGVAKRQAEHLCALYGATHGLEAVVARCFAFVGEDLPLDAHYAIGNFIRDALAGGEITVKGDGTPVRSYLDQRDLARWLTVLLVQGQGGRAYNVGSDQPVTIVELAHMIARQSGSDVPVRVLAQGQSAQRNVYVPDISRVRDELGLDVAIGLDDAIAHVLAVHRGRSGALAEGNAGLNSVLK